MLRWLLMASDSMIALRSQHVKSNCGAVNIAEQ
jgi:hypothetical protein